MVIMLSLHRYFSLILVYSKLECHIISNTVTVFYHNLKLLSSTLCARWFEFFYSLIVKIPAKRSHISYTVALLRQIVWNPVGHQECHRKKNRLHTHRNWMSLKNLMNLTWCKEHKITITYNRQKDKYTSYSGIILKCCCKIEIKKIWKIRIVFLKLQHLHSK